MTIEPETMLFKGPEGYSASFAVDAVRTMVETSKAAGRRETGGILIGRYAASGWHVDVEEATHKPKGSWAGFSWFRRGNSGLAEYLRERWKDDLHYVGEWHFHPRSSPHPSNPDLAAMKRSAADPVYDCPMPLLAILGGDPLNIWQVSATLIGPDRVPLVLAQSPEAGR